MKAKMMKPLWLNPDNPVDTSIKIQWSPTGIRRTYREMMQRAQYRGRKGRRAARLIAWVHPRNVAPFAGVPVFEHVAWNFHSDWSNSSVHPTGKIV